MAAKQRRDAKVGTRKGEKEEETREQSLMWHLCGEGFVGKAELTWRTVVREGVKTTISLYEGRSYWPIIWPAYLTCLKG